MTKPWILCAILPLFVAPALAQSGVNNQTQSGPSLGETEQWIQQTFSDDNTGRAGCTEFDAGNTLAPYGPDSSCMYTKYSIRFDQCRVTVTTSHSEWQPPKEQKLDLLLDSVVSFDLRDIDPSSIKTDDVRYLYGDPSKKHWHDESVNPPVYKDVLFQTTNERDLIAVTYPYDPHAKADNFVERVHDCCGLVEYGIAVKPEYAPRFAKALAHAVALCGGKSSPF